MSDAGHCGPLAWVNGEIVPLALARVPVEDRGLQLGDGVYEVAMVAGGRPWLAERHAERLAASLAAVRLPQVLAAARFAELGRELARASGIDSGLYYVQVTRGTAPRRHGFPRPPVAPTVIAYVTAHDFLSEDDRARGLAAITRPDIRWGRCDVKSTNLLATELARQEAFEAGTHEVLWVGEDGVVREAGSSNVFAVFGGSPRGVLRTHPLGTRVLAGVTRAVALEQAAALGIPCEERAFTLAELAGASEAFLTSTSLDAVPLVAVDGVAIGNGRGAEVTKRLLEAIRHLRHHDTKMADQEED